MYAKLNYPWQLVAFNAYMEFDPVRLHSKASKAERVICERLLNPGLTLDERIAIHDALGELKLLLLRNSNQQESKENAEHSCGASTQTPASATQARV